MKKLLLDTHTLINLFQLIRVVKWNEILDSSLKTSKIIVNIKLKPNQEQFIQEQLKSGRFNNAEQVINTAFHLLETLNEDYLQWVEETRQKIDVAIAELDKGEGLDGETVINEILEKFQQAKRK